MTPSTRRLIVAGVVLLRVASAKHAGASCNIIPSAQQTFRGTLGSTNRPFAGPGEFLEVRAPQPGTCGSTSPGFTSPDPADYAVTLVFTPPVGGRNVVVLATDCTGIGTCAGADTTTCFAAAPDDLALVTVGSETRLQFRFPDTDALVDGASDDHTLSGPVTVAVTPRASALPCGLVSGTCAAQSSLTACVDELYQRDGSCRTIDDPTFGHLTALPPPNRYEEICVTPAFPSGPCLGTAPEVRFTTDATGNVLIPVDWRGILVEHSNVPVPRLLRAGSSVEALSLSPTDPIRLPGQQFVGSYTPEGALLPPIFLPQVDPNAQNEVTLFGSADAPHTVLRIARKSTSFDVCAGGTDDNRPCVDDSQCASPGTCENATCIGGSRAGQMCDDDQFDCPGGECGGGLFDFSDRYASDVGPVVIPRLVSNGEDGVCEDGTAEGQLCTAPTTCAGGANCVDYRIAADNPVPLEGLTGTQSVFVFTVSEAIAAGDLNGDSDSTDFVLTLRDHDSGRTLPIGEGGSDGRAIGSVQQPPFAFPALATEGDVVAFLEPEATQFSQDDDGDTDIADSILRVYRRDTTGCPVGEEICGRELTAGSNIATDADTLVAGRSVAISNGLVFFRAPEPGGATQVTVRAGRENIINLSSGFDELGGRPAVSRDGHYVAFTSRAPDLVPGDTNTCTDHVTPGSCPDVFVYNTDTGEIVRVSVATDGAEGNGYSDYAAISGDGRHVAFFSRASNLIPGGYFDQTFVHDRDVSSDGTFDEVGDTSTVAVSIRTDGTVEQGGIPSISDDGRIVEFDSNSANLVDNDTNDCPPFGSAGHCPDVFVHDRDADGNGIFDETIPGARSTIRASVDSNGNQAARGVEGGVGIISADGRVVAFQSPSADLAPNDPDSTYDVFTHELDTGITERVSIRTDGTESPNSTAAGLSISADGRFVAFTAQAFAPSSSLGRYDLWIRDRAESRTDLVVAQAGFNDVYFPRLSYDGRYVAFSGADSGFVPNDTNNAMDVFLHDRVTGITSRVNVQPDGSESVGDPTATYMNVALSGDGRVVAFDSEATDLVPGDPSSVQDVYVRRAAPTPSCGNMTLDAGEDCDPPAGSCPGGASCGPTCQCNDSTQDGVLDATVLQVIDGTATPPVTPITLCPATQTAIEGGKAAFLRPESAGATSNPLCSGATLTGPDLNNDSDTDDAVVHYWSGSGNVQNLGLAATTVALSATHVAAIATTVEVYSLAASSWSDTGQAADTIAFCGSILAMITPEADQGADLNGDGDQTDRVVQLYDPASGDLVPTGAAAEEIVCNENQVALRTSEDAQGQNLNSASGDSDELDDVLQVWDLTRPECVTTSAPADCLANTGQAVRRCLLEACDPRIPYRVGQDTVKFLTFECDQGGAVTSVGCPTGGTELNGDSPEDASDLVIQSFNVRTRATISIGTVNVESEENPLPQEPAGSEAEATVYTSNGRCVETIGTSCTSNADCDNGGYCDDGDNTCKRDQGVCVGQSDCPNPASSNMSCTDDPIVAASPDTDLDGVPDHLDNCPTVANANQSDTDGDVVGNACDAFCTEAGGGDAHDSVKLKTLHNAGVLTAKLTVALAAYNGEPVTVRLEDSDAQPIASDTVVLLPKGNSGKKSLYSVKTDGLQKVQLKDLSPSHAGFFKLSVKAKRWFDSADADRPPSETMTTISVGPGCFSHFVTKLN